MTPDLVKMGLLGLQHRGTRLCGGDRALLLLPLPMSQCHPTKLPLSPEPTLPGEGCLPRGSACRSLYFIFIYYYSSLPFIYSILFLFHFEHGQLCHLGFAENVNKKLHSNAAFHCLNTFPIQHSSSAPTLKLKLKKKKATSSLYIPPWRFLYARYLFFSKNKHITSFNSSVCSPQSRRKEINVNKANFIFHTVTNLNASAFP